MPGGLVLVVDVDGVTYGMGLHVCLLSGTRLWSQLIELDLLENDAASAVGGWKGSPRRSGLGWSSVSAQRSSWFSPLVDFKFFAFSYLEWCL